MGRPAAARGRHRRGDLRPRRLLSDAPAEDGDVLLGDNLEHLAKLADSTVQLAYVDPPFNTGATQGRRTLRYPDRFDDYLAFLEPRLTEVHRTLHVSGTLYFHIDYREAHYCKLLLDDVFGRGCFLNEIIWAYDYGARTTRRWPAKHDTILVYVKDPGAYFFDSTEVDREPYMAPRLVGAEKAARGKLPTDVWWHTIVGTNAHERTGYPTQKPEGIVRRMVLASSRPGDLCLDPFCGSGTLGAVASKLGRRYLLIDESADAIAVSRKRLAAIADSAGSAS